MNAKRAMVPASKTMPMPINNLVRVESFDI